MAPIADKELWQRLSPSSRRAFELAAGAVAAAGEGGIQEWEVGSGALLVGILGAHRGMKRPSEVDDLLDWAGKSQTDLEAALYAEREGEDPFEPHGGGRVRLDGFPACDDNVAAAVAEAATLADRLRPTRAGQIPLSFLFGGVLSLRPAATAVRALTGLVPELRRVQREYPEYLQLGEQASYLDFLRRGDALPPEPRPAPHPARAANDAVSDVDQLGFDDYVAAFADLIEAPETKPPLTIGIFGSWGMGKSFLLQHLERELVRRREARARTAASGAAVQDAAPVHVVRFNAWSYSAAHVIWPALVRTIVQTVDAETLGRWGRLKTRLRRNFGRQLRQDRDTIVVSLVVAVLVAGAALLRGNWSITWFLGLSAIGFLKVAYDSAASPLGRWVGGLLKDRDYGATIDYMEEIRQDLEQLGERLDGHNARILVLIDDLDRCEAEKAVEVLQAINLLLNFPTFVVVLGIDARVVTRAIEHCHGGVMEAAGATGFEYLEKIVQIPFRIPEPDETVVASFLREQLGPAPAVEAAPRESDEPDDAGFEAGLARDLPVSGPMVRPALPPQPTTEFTQAEIDAFEELAPYLRANPRHLKRLVNVYRLVRTLAERRAEDAILDEPRRTIRWLALCSQWPYAASAMLELMDDLGEHVSDEESDPLRQLLAGVGPSLDAETRNRLDDDPDRLAALVAADGTAFTWDELVTVRRYTINFNPAVDAELADLVFAEPAA